MRTRWLLGAFLFVFSVNHAFRVFRSDGWGWHTGEFPVPDECGLVGCWERFYLSFFVNHAFRVFRSDGGVDDGVGTRLSSRYPTSAVSLVAGRKIYVSFFRQSKGMRSDDGLGARVSSRQPTSADSLVAGSAFTCQFSSVKV